MELKKAGLDRNTFGFTAEEIWSALIEIEGYQLEIDYAGKTGITGVEQNGAARQRDVYLSALEKASNKKIRAEVEKGGLDKVRARFIRNNGKLP